MVWFYLYLLFVFFTIYFCSWATNFTHYLTSTPSYLQLCIIISFTKIFKYELFFNTLKLFFRIVAMTTTSNRQFKNVCVLYGFRYKKYKEFVQTGVDLSRVLAERKIHLIYGGGDWKLSRLVSEAVHTKGSQVLSIIPKTLKPLGCLPSSPIGEELVVSSLHERISNMLNYADTFISVLGDLATLETLITFTSSAYMNIHKKSINMLNVNKFCDGLIVFLNMQLRIISFYL